MKFTNILFTFLAVAAIARGVAAQDEDTATNVGAVLNFEAPQVHPIALTSTGTRLLVVNTMDARLSVFDTTTASNPTLLTEIPVGLEPVSVRPRTTDEVWVVNHTSDSISVLSLASGLVTDTIYCKDEPCDVVFAGSPQRAYVSVAGNKEVRVFDVTTHALITTIPILGVQPRALAVSADGLKVYVTVALSGNKTTVIPASLAPAPPPPTNPNITAAPQTALIVSATDPAYTSLIPYTVSDNDVAEITTATNTVSRYFTGVGTINFNITVRPGTGDLYIPNTDARNTVRFEPVLRGHAVDNQISKITIADGSVTKFDLNPGISYANPNNPAAKAIALAQPTDAVFIPGGAAMYVASFGTDRVAKMDPVTGAILSRIEVGNTPGTTVNSAAKRGPRAMAMHPTAGRLFVLNRISNTLSVINTANDTVTMEVAVGSFDPAPLIIKNGRGFLYDAKLSGNGTMSCASCHIDGDSDHEDWDLGDPEGPEINIPDPSNTYGIIKMHPMKGPMFTQSLKGLSQGSNPLHWRGDRSDFNAFNVAFQGLLGGTQISAANMQAFTNFMMTASFEANPNLNLDRTLPATIHSGNPANGKDIFKNGSSITPIGACNNCHHLPLGTGSKIVNLNVLGQTQGLKVPQLRTSYQKMDFDNTTGATSLAGFGFGHDGAFSTMESFLSNQTTFGTMAGDAIAKRDLTAFMMCIDTNTPPATGYSRTAKSTNVTTPSITNDLNMLISRVNAGEIDLIAKGRIDGVLHGFVYVPQFNNFQTDKGGYGPFSWSQLVTKIQAGGTLTFMGVPKDAGHRMGVDHNMNGIPDFEDITVTELGDFGSSSPPCATNLHISANSSPYIANSNFAFTATGCEPNQLALVIAASGPGIEDNNPVLLGVKLWVDVAATEVFAIDMWADDLGFGFAKIAIPNNVNLVGIEYSAMVLSLNSCSPNGLAGSQGIRFDIQEGPPGN